MKKLTLIVSALALLIGFSQCKKEVITPNANDNRIQITLNANYGGEKTSFTPATGQFAWSTSKVEYINVGCNVAGETNGYLGQLQNNGAGSSTFTGEITIPDGTETLYFFYLGNGNHANATTVDFSNQNGIDVTNCHIAIGSAPYSGTSYNNVTLNMAMAIARFNLSGFGDGNIYLNGNDVYNTATIDYTNGTIRGNSKGYINVGTAGSKYVALIPSVETETTINFNSNNKTGSMTFLRGIKPASYYSNSGSALVVSASDGSRLFSVSATKKVFFSPGNLQYLASTGTWRFAEHQYDYIGNAAGNTTSVANRPTQSDWIDLFGFGTSGRNGKNPYLATTQSNDYIKTNLSGDDDWGSAIGDKWRTPTQEEWSYLLNRADRKGTGTVNNIKGLILLPDLWTGSAIVTNCADWTSNTFTAEQWSAMELAGAVFLPAAGFRNGTTVTSAGSNLYYWSSTMKDTSTAYLVYVYNKSWGTYELTINTAYNQSVYYGNAVRLVYDVE